MDGACQVPPPSPCDPIRPGEFGACEAVLGWGVGADGQCAVVSGCGCDEGCAGRVFDDEAACEAACEAPVGCPDADIDRICDADDSVCNADGTLLMCRRVAPDCPRGTVPEVRNGCYTDVCVSWDDCGEGPAPDCQQDADCAADEICLNQVCEPAPMCGRRAELDPNDRMYDRFEGTGANNACRQDADCVIGGCSAEVCAAEPAISTCEGLP
ncbi:MAG: hypothetical protein KC620_26630, partial [Myxococcales bacterium]|nr:hypothetical protein [Myxococcales bacterium]